MTKVIKNCIIKKWDGYLFEIELPSKETILADIEISDKFDCATMLGIDVSKRVEEYGPRYVVTLALEEGYLVIADLALLNNKYYLYKVYVRAQPTERKMRIKLSEVNVKPRDYVQLKMGRDGVGVQTDGFIVYSSPTGQGKTFFALDNMLRLSEKFDKVVILAYEITEQDYAQSLLTLYNKKDIKTLAELFDDKVIIEFEQDINKLKEIYNEGKIAFVVDNIDNIALANDESSFYQAEWLKGFDRMLKENGYFGIVLSQLNNKASKDKYENVTLDHVAGSKERVDLSRAVFFTWYDEQNKVYQYKPLKFGTTRKSIIGGTVVWKELLEPTLKGQA